MRPRRILPVIVLPQFAGTSLWFAGNAVLGDLELELALPAGALGHVTSAVQLGFIAGTLAFAFFAISDIVSPRLVFFLCSLAGAAANAASYALAEGLASLLALRFATGKRALQPLKPLDELTNLRQHGVDLREGEGLRVRLTHVSDPGGAFGDVSSAFPLGGTISDGAGGSVPRPFFRSALRRRLASCLRFFSKSRFRFSN